MTSRRDEPRFDDGAAARSDFRDRGRSAGRDRKTLQLCAQIRRALELAFVGVCEDPALQDLMLLDVSPAPDASRLLVRCAPVDGVEDHEVLERIERSRGLWTPEVLQSITRRKAPEMVFQIDHTPQ